MNRKLHRVVSQKERCVPEGSKKGNCPVPADCGGGMLRWEGECGRSGGVGGGGGRRPSRRRIQWNGKETRWGRGGITPRKGQARPLWSPVGIPDPLPPPPQSQVNVNPKVRPKSAGPRGVPPPTQTQGSLFTEEALPAACLFRARGHLPTRRGLRVLGPLVCIQIQLGSFLEMSRFWTHSFLPPRPSAGVSLNPPPFLGKQGRANT